MRTDAQKNYEQILEVARDAVAANGASTSLRDIARRANVGLGTLYRHFPTREALMEAVLRSSLDDLSVKAAALETTGTEEEALIAWLREAVAFSSRYRGAVALMASALDDENSALHVSCTMVRSACARLLARAQAAGVARRDIDGADLLSLVAAVGWLHEQPALAPRADRLFEVVADAVLAARPR